MKHFGNDPILKRVTTQAKLTNEAKKTAARD